MPLSEPSGGGGGAFSVGPTMSFFPVRNTGADISIILSQASWDEINGRILVGGNNDYMGTKATAFAKLQQATNLPPTVSNTCGCIVVNRTDGGVLYMAPNALWRTDAALGPWTLITPPAVVSRNICFTLAGDGHLYSMVANGTENSLDNGATWDANFTFSIDGAALFGRTNRTGSVVCVCGQAVNAAGVAYRTTQDPTAGDAGWTSHSLDGFGVNCNYAAFSDDGTKLVVGTTNGQVSTLNGLITGNEFQIPLASNPFAQTVNNGLSIDFIEYSPDLGGFLIASMFTPILGFIDENDMTVIQQSVWLGPNGVTAGGLFGGGWAARDDNGDIIVFGTNNTGAVFMRFV